MLPAAARRLATRLSPAPASRTRLHHHSRPSAASRSATARRGRGPVTHVDEWDPGAPARSSSSPCPPCARRPPIVVYRYSYRFQAWDIGAAPLLQTRPARRARMQHPAAAVEPGHRDPGPLPANSKPQSRRRQTHYPALGRRLMQPPMPPGSSVKMTILHRRRRRIAPEALDRARRNGRSGRCRAR